MLYVLIILGVLVAAGLVVLARVWHRSRQHVGISRPADTAGVNDNPEAAMTPTSTSYKQVIAPGQATDVSTGIPLRVEDVLAKRPGAPEPGQTFSPGSGPDEPGKNPTPPENPPSQS